MSNTADPLIHRSEALYGQLGIDQLIHEGVVRDHDRHYGMIVYPSIKSSEDAGWEDVFGEVQTGSARLYVHIPFCTGRCTFCHFQLASTRHTDRYMDHLLREIELVDQNRRQIGFHGLFVGGGTPSLLPRRHLVRLLETVVGGLGVDSQGFNTMELHPEFVREPDALERLQEIKALGINRISIGVQAFEQVILDNLNRRHTVEENYQAIELVRRAGFDYIDIDIMYGLPGQTLAQWAHTLEEVVRLPIDSVSIFYLIIKQATAMGRNEAKTQSMVPARRESVLMHIMACEHLREGGFIETLTDHFHREYPDRATGSFQSNVVYSEFFVIPVGISGWGYMNSQHYWNSFDLDKYSDMIGQDQLPITRAVRLGPKERLRRDIMFCLKYGEIRFDAIVASHGVDPLSEYAHVFDVLQDLGLVNIDSEAARLTYQGRLFMEETCTFFFSPATARDCWVPVNDRADRQLDTFNYMISPRRPESKQILALVAHPDPDSFTHRLLQAFHEGAAPSGHEITVIDLYKEGYQSQLAAAEIGSTQPDADVKRHQEMVRRADILAFFYPIWWYSAPAILRGWLERTWMVDFAFSFSAQTRYQGLLTDKRALIINNAADSVEGFANGWGPAYLENQIGSVFDMVGISRRYVRIFLNVHHQTEEAQEKSLDELRFLGMQAGLPRLYEPGRTVWERDELASQEKMPDLEVANMRTHRDSPANVG